MRRLPNFIAGKWADPKAGKWLDVFEPATGQSYAQVADSDESDVHAAIAAAENALPSWSKLTAQERSGYLRKIANLIREKSTALARAESVDSGKLLKTAETIEIPRAASNFEFFADAITQFSSESHLSDAQTLNYTLRSPVGVVGCISPWNLPLYLLTWKIAPALASGNTVVAKPSEITPMTAFLLGEIAVEAGLPAGVLNLVQGRGPTAGAALVASPKVKALSFTGSTRTGAEIARTTAGQFKKLSLEMGGKNATLVFADCDLNQAVDEALRAAYSNQGQICLCGSRILVEKSIYERFKQALVSRVSALRVGDPLDPKSDQGAVVSQEHQEKILSAIAFAQKEGGRVLAGGGAAKLSGRCAQGWFVEPTLFEGLGPECRTNQDEIFGPVATLIPFESEEEANEEISADESEEESVAEKPSSKRLRTGLASKREIDFEKELKLEREAREEDRRVRLELEKKVARLEKDKASSKSSSTAAETKEENSCCASSDNASSCRESGRGSVKARYHELKDIADEIATVDELARLKKDNLLMKKAMNWE